MFQQNSDFQSEFFAIFYDHYDAEALNNIIDAQHTILEYMNEHNHTTLYSILLVVGDFAVYASISRHPEMLHQLLRGRHNSCSIIMGAQQK